MAASTSLQTKYQKSNGRPLIPTRFFSEAFGCVVLWHAKTYNLKAEMSINAVNFGHIFLCRVGCYTVRAS